MPAVRIRTAAAGVTGYIFGSHRNHFLRRNANFFMEFAVRRGGSRFAVVNMAGRYCQRPRKEHPFKEQEFAGRVPDEYAGTLVPIFAIGRNPPVDRRVNTELSGRAAVTGAAIERLLGRIIADALNCFGMAVDTLFVLLTIMLDGRIQFHTVSIYLSHGTLESTMSTSVRRLYTELKPSHYELRVVPDVAAMTFTGTVSIRLKKTGRPSQRLTFHQHGLKIDSARVTKCDKKGDRELPVTRINNQDTLDEVRLHTEEMVYSGDYDVTMAFHGTITRGMTGLYPCFFTVEGKEHVMLATQFESHHARELFPCIDEPEAKATFDLSLVAPAGRTVLANTPVAATKPLDNGLIETTFETTPKMSTYLLAFAIGELHCKRATTARGTTVSVWATIAQPAGALDFAVDVAKRAIEFFEDYFGVPYPLPKADHLALPDFTSGAMENWGLITYRERLLLAYPGEASQSAKETITTVITHETSHQWFGNLVTMRWWDELWLNESFANMMEYQATDALFPEWHVWETFIMSEGLSALRRDASPAVQAVQGTVRHPDDITASFDPSIVYAKGGRLLYMLKTYIGDDAFRKGLTAYFTKHAYGNTTGDDLWQALQAASGVDVAAFMRPWLLRPGFPVISVDQQGRDIRLRQAHFLESGEANDGRIWPVPLFSNHPELPDRLDRAELHRTLADETPLVINRGSAGHYIVHYVRPEHRTQLVTLVRQQKLGEGDRLMLLNNASMLARAGYQSFADVLQLLDAYRQEHSEAVWDIISLILAEARRFVDLDERLETQLKALVRELIRGEYQRLGWEEKPDEPAADTKLRATIISLGAYADDPAIIKEATRHFRQYRKDQTGIPAELRAIIFGVPVKQNTDEAFTYLLNLHDHTANSDLKSDAMAGLTITRDPAAARVLLERLTDAKLVKPQDADYWLIYLLRNRYVREVAWQWMEDNWHWIEATYAGDKSYDIFPRAAASACNTRAWAEHYRTFFEPKQEQLILRRNIAIGLSEIATRVAWLERDLPAVQAFFSTAI